LSPILWNMVVNSLLVRLNNESLWAQGFVDDIAIVIKKISEYVVCELMQNALYIIQALCRGLGLSVNGPFHQQQEVSGLQKAYTIWNGIAVEKSS
jgi:hypothetical protein